MDRVVWSLVTIPFPLSTLEIAVAVDADHSKEPIKFFICFELNLLKIVPERLGTIQMLFASNGWLIQNSVVICLRCKQSWTKSTAVPCIGNKYMGHEHDVVFQEREEIHFCSAKSGKPFSHP